MKKQLLEARLTGADIAPILRNSDQGISTAPVISHCEQSKENKCPINVEVPPSSKRRDTLPSHTSMPSFPAELDDIGTHSLSKQSHSCMSTGLEARPLQALMVVSTKREAAAGTAVKGSPNPAKLLCVDSSSGGGGQMAVKALKPTDQQGHRRIDEMLKQMGPMKFRRDPPTSQQNSPSTSDSQQPKNGGTFTQILMSEVSRKDLPSEAYRSSMDGSSVAHKSPSLDRIVEVLRELSEVQRKEAQEKALDNTFRLGKFQSQLQGHKIFDRWIDGWAFQEVDRKLKSIETSKEDLEKCRKLWTKRKGKLDEMSDYYLQLEIFELRKQVLTREEKELQNELEVLSRERNIHIKEMKRLASEEASRFRNHPILDQRYLLLNLLGKGGFSEVFKVFDLKENQYLACKIHQYSRDWSKDRIDNYTKHAARELAIHKSLTHSRIVKIADAFPYDEMAFCTVMEFVEGNDLEFHLKQNKFIPEREARAIIIQIVSALKYLNEQKPPIIHYDLKPGNILLTNWKHAGEVKITDFGLSKLMTQDTYDSGDFGGIELTSQGAGTYWYLPPECFDTSGPSPPKISSKVDVWSLGVIFYQCLFGKRPFGNDMTQSEVFHGNVILNARTVNFPTVPKVSDGAKDFIRRCLTYRKENRPDVLEIANDDYLWSKLEKAKS